MNKKIGKVIEVSIPEYENGKKIDVMYSTKIAFKIFCDNEIIEIIEEQNDENAQILKGSLVEIEKNADKYSLNLLGDLYE